MEQGFTLFYRSYTRGSQTGIIRPDGVDLLLQQEYEYSPSRYNNWTDEIQPHSWKKPSKGSSIEPYDPGFLELDRFFYIAECNIILPFDKSEEAEVEICNSAVSLVEAYVHTSNHHTSISFAMAN